MLERPVNTNWLVLLKGILQFGIKFPVTASYSELKRIPNTPDGSKNAQNGSNDKEDSDDQDAHRESE